MASDRDQALKAAEKLIKAGKKSVALAQFRKICTNHPEDLALHNRIGDMLCLAGLGAEAVPYYEKVAFAYRDSGFMPKAVAMFKKILRQQPDSFETMVELGNLYLSQRLPGEARNYLLHAADQYIKNSGFQRAGEIYRTLVDAEPEEPGHRIRLAETLAATGKKEEAVRELLATAEKFHSPETSEAHLKILRRAMDLSPEAPEPALAVARCLAETGEADQAMKLLDEHINTGSTPGPFLQAKLRMVLAGEQPQAALDLFTDPRQEALDGDDFARILDAFRKGPGADEFWERIDPWLAGNGSRRAEAVLLAAAELEQPGYLPALIRLARHMDDNGDGQRTAGVLERLITTLRAKQQHEEASGFEDRLRALRPDSPLLRGPDPVNAPEPKPVDRPAAAPVEPSSVEPSSVDTDERSAFPELEAPAVPLNTTDEEFASGRLTQAEILEKYGLDDKALDQVREVVERFPGHVAGQKHLVELVKSGKDKALVRDAWTGLAFAQRASGNLKEARKAATLAEATCPMEDATRQALEAFHLIGDVPETRAVKPTPEPTPVPTPEPTPEPVDMAAAPLPDADDDDMDVLFEEEPDPGPQPDPGSKPEPEPGATLQKGDAGEDLASLAAALEGELFLDDDEPLVPEAPREQSLDEVFAAFQEQVEKQVDSDDFQTHYDLGIAYREMGLLNEAIAEFKRTVRPGAFHREACIMIASCHRDAGRVPDAADWYRKALEIPNDDEEAQSGLRYDLAEVLAEIGEMKEALGLYRIVMEMDPSFRDISERVSQLENHLGH